MVLLHQGVRRGKDAGGGLPAGGAVVPVYAKELWQFLASVKVLGFVGIRNSKAGVDALFAVGEVVELLDYGA